MFLEIRDGPTEDVDVIASVANHKVALRMDDATDATSSMAVIDGLPTAAEWTGTNRTKAVLVCQHPVIVIRRDPKLLAAMALVVSAAFRLLQFSQFTTPFTVTCTASPTSARQLEESKLLKPLHLSTLLARHLSFGFDGSPFVVRQQTLVTFTSLASPLPVASIRASSAAFPTTMSQTVSALSVAGEFIQSLQFSTIAALFLFQ